MSKSELIPSARRLITSLRDIGYDFPSAVADIVDNAVEAGATNIAVDIDFDGDRSFVRIADNGCGMNPERIREALRFGSTSSYGERSLGRFGLGLKTASLSQCRRLTVASRTQDSRRVIHAYAWDLDHVAQSDRWEIVDVSRDSCASNARVPLAEQAGTVVMWERLDRILGFKNPYGGFAKRRLEVMCADLQEHLAMIFHRYLEGGSGRRKLRIKINGRPVNAWDPFARGEAGTLVMPPSALTYRGDGISGEIRVQPYVLPHQDRFSSPAAHAAAAGPQKWNRQQGFYIYRADRMIQAGGWSGIRTLDEHLKLARVALSFEPRLDEAFKINVAKMRVQLPQQLREDFEKVVAPALRAAQAAYRSQRPPAKGESALRATLSSQRQEQQPAAVNGKVIQRPATDTSMRLWTVDQFRREVDKIAWPEERAVVSNVFNRLKDRIELGV